MLSKVIDLGSESERCSLTLFLIGYNMAKNLHAKIPPTDTLLIRDVNQESTNRFLQEASEAAKGTGANVTTRPKVEVADSARDLAEKSVSSACFGPSTVAARRVETCFISAPSVSPGSARRQAFCGWGFKQVEIGFLMCFII